MILFLLGLAAGFFLLVKGSDYFVEGSAGMAKRFGIPEIVIGLTIVAMGTSAPEAAVSISAAFQGAADISIGNVVGSNILNILIILGLTSVLSRVPVKKNTIIYEMPFMVLVSLVLLIMGLDKTVTLWDGVILCLLFVVYLVYLFICAKNNKEETEEDNKSRPLIMQIVFAVGGVAAIIIGSKLAVYGATGVATALGVSERFIGLTVVALGTSLPELFTSVTAARKGNTDIAIGNIVGSNIFNILFVIGITALITPVPYAEKFIIDGIIMVVSAVLLILLVLKDKALNKPAGVVMLAGYGAYFAYLCIMS